MNSTLNKILSLTFALLVGFGAKAQLNEAFDNVTVSSTPWGTGTQLIGGMPPGWTQYSLDGKTVNSNIASAFGNNGWVTIALQVSAGVYDTMAMSTSYYDPAGQSNDWLISPQVTVPSGSGQYLIWTAASLNPDYLESYDVYVGTSASPSSFTTKIGSFPSEPSTFTSHALNISAYAGQSVYFAFVNVSNDMFLLALDDIKIETLNQPDLGLARLGANRIQKAGQNMDVVGTVVNLGQPVNSFTVEWNDGSGPQSASFSPVPPIAPYGTYDFTHTVPFNKSAVDEYTVNVNITSVNGGTDADPSNNSADFMTSIVSQTITKYPLIEEGTGTWCGWCPRGAVAMDELHNRYNDFIGIAVHNGDPMTVTAYDAAAAFGGYPSSNADRILLDVPVSTDNFDILYTELKKLTPPLDLSSSTYTVSGQTITVNAEAKLATKYTDEVRLAAIVVEDGVTGTSAGYAQANYYSGGSNGAMGGYESKSDPVPARDMVYDHVGRALLGGYEGQAGSVPSFTDGATANYTFSYTVPTTNSIENSHVVVLAIRQDNGQVLNAYRIDNPDAVKSVDANTINMQLYPNPVNKSTEIKATFDLNEEVTATVYDIAGKVITQKTVAKNAGEVAFDTDQLSSGSYLMTIATKEASYTQVFTVK